MVIVKTMGGLGNQLFQYAVALTLANKNKEVYLETRYFRRDKYKRSYSLDFLPQRLNILGDKKTSFFIGKNIFYRMARSFRKMPETRIINEKKGASWQTAINTPDNKYNWHIQGHWQSAQMVKETPYLLADLQTARDGIAIPDDIAHISPERYVCIHTRQLWQYDSRGAKVKKAKSSLPPVFCGVDYYAKAIEKIRPHCENPFFLLFGDSPEWNKKHLQPLVGNDCIAIHPGSRPDWQDMLLMAKCPYHITSNSSFSWWAAYISQGFIITSQKWPTPDICPSQWKVLHQG